MSKKRVLVFTEYIGENHNSTAYYWSQIVKYLSVDYDVKLVVPENSHSIEFIEKYSVDACLVKHAKHNKNSLFSRLWGQLRQSTHLVMSIRRELKQSDLVFSGTNPIVAMGLMAILAKLHKCQWLVLVHDIFPNNLVPARIIKPRGFVYRVLAYFSRCLYSVPTHLISIGRDMKALLAEKTGKSTAITYIPNWASTEIIQLTPKHENVVLRQFGWIDSDTVVFQFFGNLGRLQGIQNLLDAIDITQSERARFLFIGDGSEQAKLIEKVNKINERWGYERALYYGSMPLSQNHVGLTACDVSMVTLSSNMYGLGVPSKAYFSLAADKPILYVGDVGSELSLLLEEYPTGWFVESDDVAGLAEKIDLIADTEFDSKGGEVSPRQILETHFSELQALHKIEQVVRNLV